MQYIKINEVTNMLFYQIPKVLFAGIYKDMSLGAKVVYAFLRDRVSLSIKNNWVDEMGNVFIYYAREHLAQDLGISEKSARNYMKELVKYDLIKEIRQRLSKPNIIYVGTPLDTENIASGKIYRYGKENNSVKERQNLPSNNTDINKTKKNETKSLQFLDEIVWTEEVFPYIQSYLNTRCRYRNKIHKRIQAKYIRFINDAVNKLIENYISLDMFNETVKDYFDDLADSNDGDIVYFLQVSQPREFGITEDRVSKDDYI